MEHASNQDKSAFATEPVGRLIVKFAIPCDISLVVNALYNIVDQIFIGWGVGYLGNGATNVVFPIAIGLPFTMISTALNAMIRADGSPKFAMVSMLLGAIINTVFDPIFIFIFDMGVRGAAIATILGQIISFLVSIFYLPRFKTFHSDPLGATSAQARLSERPQSGCQQLHHPDCNYHRDGTLQQPARRLWRGFGLRLRDSADRHGHRHEGQPDHAVHSGRYRDRRAAGHRLQLRLQKLPPRQACL